MMRFDDQVAVVTGSGRGLGEAYARLLAERGARVVAHDAGVTLDGQGFDTSVADSVVNKIITAGGSAVACYENLETREGCRSVVLTSSGHALWTEGAQPELSGYAIGKSAQIGLMNMLAANGAGVDIRVNIISPVAATRIFTSSVAPGALRPEQVAPGVVFLASSACNVSGIILRAGNGHFSAMRWQVGPEVEFGAEAATPETIAEKWELLSAFPRS